MRYPKTQDELYLSQKLKNERRVIDEKELEGVASHWFGMFRIFECWL